MTLGKQKRDMNGDFTEDKIEAENYHMKSFSALIIKKIKIKTAMRLHVTFNQI